MTQTRSWIVFSQRLDKNLGDTVCTGKKVLLTIGLAVCSCRRFLEVGGAILFQTGACRLNENLVQHSTELRCL